jgi:hypothetical protein
VVNYLSYKDVGQGTSTVLKTMQVSPGIRKDLTLYQAEGGWIDSNLIRFRDGRAQSIGGWSSEILSYGNKTNGQFTGVSRNILAWVALDSSKWLAVGGSTKLELASDGQIFDITPTIQQVTITGMGTVQGSSIVTLIYDNHGLTVGDFIQVVSQNVEFENISLSGGYGILTVPDNNTFTFDSGQIAYSTSMNMFSSDFGEAFDHGTNIGSSFNDDFSNAFGGENVVLVINFLIPTGSVSNGNLNGYGGGPYGETNGYNLPTAGVGGLNLQKWSLDNWGEDLIACPAGDTLYYWTKANGVSVSAQPIANAPAQVGFMMVAEPARFLCAFGCNTAATGIYDPLNIRWATEETTTDWEINQYNTAGEYRIPTGNKIVAVCQTQQEIFVMTDTAVYSMVFLGANDPTNSIFQFTLIGTNISCASPTGVVTLNGAVYWMGLDNFYTYNGAVVNIVPNTIARFLFQQGGEGQYNFSQKEKIFCGLNKEFNEIWWLYPRFDEEECGHYVKYQFLDQVWDVGTIDRTVWLDKGVFEYPYAISATTNPGQLYSQENGLTADGQALPAYITTAYFDIDDGENLTFCDRMVPDIDLQPNQPVQVTIYSKKFPYPVTENTVKGPFNFDNTDNFISMRVRGRQVAVQFAAVSTGSSFALGKIRLAYAIDGER